MHAERTSCSRAEVETWPIGVFFKIFRFVGMEDDSLAAASPSSLPLLALLCFAPRLLFFSLDSQHTQFFYYLVLFLPLLQCEDEHGNAEGGEGEGHMGSPSKWCALICEVRGEEDDDDAATTTSTALCAWEKTTWNFLRFLRFVVCVVVVCVGCCVLPIINLSGATWKRFFAFFKFISNWIGIALNCKLYPAQFYFSLLDFSSISSEKILCIHI